MKNYALKRFVLLLLIVIGIGRAVDATTDEPDMLAFWVSDNSECSTVLYNPVTHESHTTAGQIPFSSIWPENSDVYLSEDQLAAIIGPGGGYILGWSPDRSLLAFVANADGDSQLIYVWDGEEAINVTPKEIGDAKGYRYEIAWSPDGRLAFSPYSYANNASPTEIYLWQGGETLNLSQNPDGYDTWPVWNSKNEIAFLSEKNLDYDIFVWDGKSLKNGAPDSSRFVNAAPELTGYISHPIWTNTDQLAFTGSSPNDTHHQIYLWDGETATNISQNPDFHNGGPTWNNKGYWAFVTFFSSKLYIRDTQNHTILTTEGEYPPAWSADGNLIFCRRDRPNWDLMMWDGSDIIEITHGYDIWAQWQSGQRVVCTSG